METRPVGTPEDGADGAVYQRVEILDDLSHLPEWKRPPKIVWQQIKAGYQVSHDRTLHRNPLDKIHPGKDIALLKGKHRGKCAVLCNGESLSQWDLHTIKVPTIGMNRTSSRWLGYDGPDPDYYCFIDQTWIAKNNVRGISSTLINCSSNPEDIGYRLIKSWRKKPFSLDLARDGAVPATTGHMALQLAGYLGFTEIYCLGMDFNMKPHFDGTPSGKGMIKQPEFIMESLPILKWAGINLYLCAPSQVDLPIKSFEDLC